MQQNRHAYLIMAHHQFDLLKMLIRLLDHPNHDIFIHINKTAADFDESEFKDITKNSQIYFVPRKKVVWGGYSQINCELHLLKSALAKGEYSYCHLLSGVDLPLKTADELYHFFESHNGTEFVQTTAGDEGWQQSIKKRISHYCIFQELAGRDNKLWTKRQEKLRHWQYTLEIDRTKKLGKTIMSGANWFSITAALAKHTVDNERWIKKHFGNGICADELFLQTLICGTAFEENLYIKIPQTVGAVSCMRHIDWKRGEPYVFTASDFDELVNSECMFARKFDIEKHPEICYKLYDYLIQKSE